MAGMPKAAASSAAFTTRSTDRRNARHRADLLRHPTPSHRNTGQIRSPTERILLRQRPQRASGAGGAGGSRDGGLGSGAWRNLLAGALWVGTPAEEASQPRPALCRAPPTKARKRLAALPLGLTWNAGHLKMKRACPSLR